MLFNYIIALGIVAVVAFVAMLFAVFIASAFFYGAVSRLRCALCGVYDKSVSEMGGICATCFFEEQEESGDLPTDEPGVVAILPLSSGYHNRTFHTGFSPDGAIFMSNGGDPETLEWREVGRDE